MTLDKHDLICRLRSFVSILLALVFVLMLVSGSVIYLSPSGRIAGSIDWAVAGLDRHDWVALHVMSAVTFIFLGVTHIALHWRSLVLYIRGRLGSFGPTVESLAAAIVAIFLVITVVLEIPPATTAIAWHEYFRQQYWTGAVPQASADETVGAPMSSSPQPGTTAEGRLLFDRKCARCHAAADFTLSADDAEATRAFLSRHGSATSEEAAAIVDYLTAGDSGTSAAP